REAGRAAERGLQRQGAELEEVAREMLEDQRRRDRDDREFRERLGELGEPMDTEHALEARYGHQPLELRHERLEAEREAAERDRADHARNERRDQQRP